MGMVLGPIFSSLSIFVFLLLFQTSHNFFLRFFHVPAFQTWWVWCLNWADQTVSWPLCSIIIFTWTSLVVQWLWLCASTAGGFHCGFNPWVRKIPWRKKWQPNSSILAWEIPWTGEPGGLQSMGSQKSWTWLSNQKTKTTKVISRERDWKCLLNEDGVH